jgi:hypothetical protein
MHVCYRRTPIDQRRIDLRKPDVALVKYNTSRNSGFCDYINDSVLSHLGHERLSQVLTGAVVVDKSYRAFPVVSDMSSIILLGSSLMVLGDVAADMGDSA